MTDIQPHYISGYAKHVQNLVKSRPIDEAMEIAVGGNYDGVGKVEADILCRYGLAEGQSVIDIGCGSGRLSKHLGIRFKSLKYLGTDVEQSLLDYAKAQSPDGYRFLLHRELSIPASDASADFIVAFSVITHLFHEESFVYLREAKRALARGGTIIFSYIDSVHHWSIFETMLSSEWLARRPYLNMLIERPMIETWAKKLDLDLTIDVDGALGQILAVFRKHPHL